MRHAAESRVRERRERDPTSRLGIPSFIVKQPGGLGCKPHSKCSKTQRLEGRSGSKNYIRDAVRVPSRTCPVQLVLSCLLG